MFLQDKNIHFTYLGTGCIYNYDNEHTETNYNGFDDDSKPNFLVQIIALLKVLQMNL